VILIPARNSKSEFRNPKQFQNRKSKCSKPFPFRFFVFDFLYWSFEFVSDFEFRISDFGLLGNQLLDHSAMNVGQAEISAGVAVGEPFVIEAQKPE
jgi:hypothetical protein